MFKWFWVIFSLGAPEDFMIKTLLNYIRQKAKKYNNIEKETPYI